MKLAHVFLALLALDVILGLTHFAPVLATLLTVTLVAMGVTLGVRFARASVRKSIWRLRNRLIVTYAFIAVVPILLTLALAAIGMWMIVGQAAVYLVSSELLRRTAELENPARFLSRANAAERAGMIQQIAPLLGDRLPGFELLVRSDDTVRYPPASTLEIPAAGWDQYTGIVLKDGRYYCISIARAGKTQTVLRAPVNAALMGKLAPGIGIVYLTGTGAELNRRDVAGMSAPKYSFADVEISWLGVIPARVWDNPAGKRDAALVVTTRPSAVLSALFGTRMEDAQVVLVAFVIIASLLFIVEALSLVVGVSLTRTITLAVHGLYEGTNRVARGDFVYRIPVKGKDQLAELGVSFNDMTTRLESLVLVAKEKERLQSEIEIASEVQDQLFPRSAPSMRTIELVGTCHPARMVSGDYYDYLCLPDGNLALAIGDVAGKGISAALLMASIQSIMRTQLAAGLPVALATGGGHTFPHFCTAGVVAQLNRQLYASTAPEKYATFFFGVYDEHSRLLTYTNAGHLKPLLLHKGQVTLLEVTGTVVGLFPSVSYEEQTIRIESGDLLIAYTDGITEPENAYGEEFGEDRLAQVVMRHQSCEPAEIVSKIMEAVTHWSTAPELPDDMTVVIARGLS